MPAAACKLNWPKQRDRQIVGTLPQPWREQLVKFSGAHLYLTDICALHERPRLHTRLGVLTRFAGSVAAAVGPANYQAHQHQNTCENLYQQALIHATYICIWIPYICIVNCICLCIFISARLAVTHLCSNWTSRAVCAFDLKFSFIVWALLSSILSLSRSRSLFLLAVLLLQFNRISLWFQAVPPWFSFSLSINPLIIADFVWDYKSPESVFIFYLDISRKRVFRLARIHTQSVRIFRLRRVWNTFIAIIDLWIKKTTTTTKHM